MQVVVWSIYKWWMENNSCSARILHAWTAAYHSQRLHRACSRLIVHSAHVPFVRDLAVIRNLMRILSCRIRHLVLRMASLSHFRKIQIPMGCARLRRSCVRMTTMSIHSGTVWTRRRSRCSSMVQRSMFPSSIPICSVRKRSTMFLTRGFCLHLRVAIVRQTQKRCARATKII